MMILQAIELHDPFHSNNTNRIQIWYLMMSYLLNNFRTAWHTAANYCQLEGRRASTKVLVFPWKIPVIYSLCLKNEFLFHWLNLYSYQKHVFIPRETSSAKFYNKTRAGRFPEGGERTAFPACLELLCVGYLLREKEGSLDSFQKSEGKMIPALEGVKILKLRPTDRGEEVKERRKCASIFSSSYCFLETECLEICCIQWFPGPAHNKDSRNVS